MSNNHHPLDGKNIVTIKECLKDDVLSNQDTIFVDGSWHLDTSRNGRQEYEAGPRIKGAKFFDVDDVSSKGDLNPKDLPHMMPTKELFAAAMDALQIQNNNHVIIYGTQGSSPQFTARTWYTFINMGHDANRVHLLEESLNEWVGAGGPIEKDSTKVSFLADDLNLEEGEFNYVAQDASNFVNMQDVLAVVNDIMAKTKEENAANVIDKTVIIDTRPAGRFNAEAPEPRQGVRGGHMPGAINIPFMDLLDSSSTSKTLKPKDELKQIFTKAGVDIENESTPKIIVSCGSGMLACLVAVALEECGRDPKGTFVYDGSWTEWGLDPDTPVVK